MGLYIYEIAYKGHCSAAPSMPSEMSWSYHMVTDIQCGHSKGYVERLLCIGCTGH